MAIFARRREGLEDRSFAGLTDDHFFYVVLGWQMLYGDLPVRDFVDHGAPLHFWIAAAVQVLFGRGTLSEFAFTTTMLPTSRSRTSASRFRWLRPTWTSSTRCAVRICSTADSG